MVFLESVAFSVCFRKTQDYDAPLQDVGWGMDTLVLVTLPSSCLFCAGGTNLGQTAGHSVSLLYDTNLSPFVVVFI